MIVPIDSVVVADTNRRFQRMSRYYFSQLQVDGIDSVSLLLHPRVSVISNPTGGRGVHQGSGHIGLGSAIRSIGAGGGWVSPGHDEGFALLRPLLGAAVTGLSVDPDGYLTLEFTAGGVRCRTDDRFESWNVNAPDIGLVVCTPGGGLSVWDPA